jgi:hypothetical protein
MLKLNLLKRLLDLRTNLRGSALADAVEEEMPSTIELIACSRSIRRVAVADFEGSDHEFREVICPPA